MTELVNLDTKPTKVETFLAVVEERDGRPVLVPWNQSGWILCLSKLKGAEVVVRLERPKARQSDAQRNYLWGVVYPDVLAGLRELAVSVGEECPFKDEDELHAACKYMFLGTEIVSIAGTKIERPSTTTTLTKPEYSAYTERIILWAGERGIPIRTPNEEFVV